MNLRVSQSIQLTGGEQTDWEKLLLNVGSHLPDVPGPHGARLWVVQPENAQEKVEVQLGSQQEGLWRDRRRRELQFDQRRLWSGSE